MNFSCVFSSCDYKGNNIGEEEFLSHLREIHRDDILAASKKENMPIQTVEMMAVSNSRVFVNPG